jgi:beta-alanine degradation protein BauB
MHDDADFPIDALRRALLAAVPAACFAPVASAQDATAVQPHSYRVVLENDSVRVLEFVSRPGLGICGSGMHSHPAHLTVALSPAKVRVKLPDGKTMVVENKTGDAFWSEAETHETENLTGKNVRALIVEVKRPKAKA